MILMPSDEVQLINSVITEMDKDNELREQVYASVKKILKLKAIFGLT
jgi:beta-N-acetylhexosaminidase